VVFVSWRQPWPFTHSRIQHQDPALGTGHLFHHTAHAPKLRHMTEVSNPVRARERIQAQINQIGWLRGSGPNPFDYDLWDDRTAEVLRATYGEGSPELQRYWEAAGKRGRLPGVRGQAENMTLNIHGPWGILARLSRAETLLDELVASLPKE
jgi:hypothetical protein